MKISLIVLSALLFGVSVVDADIDMDTLHVVDYQGAVSSAPSSVMFRGNTPLANSGKVDYAEWYNAMSKVAQAELGSPLVSADQLYIVDVGFEDASDVVALAEFWNNPANAAKGKYFPMPYGGNADFPADFTPAEQEAYVRNASTWADNQFPSRVEQVHALLVQGPPAGYKQLAIYTHCFSGWNKVGAFIDAYRVSHYKKIETSRMSGGLKVNAPPMIRASSEGAVIKDLYALGCREGQKCPVKAFTGIVGWYCIWSNVFNNTTYTDCSNGYTCASSGCLPVM